MKCSIVQKLEFAIHNIGFILFGRAGHDASWPSGSSLQVLAIRASWLWAFHCDPSRRLSSNSGFARHGRNSAPGRPKSIHHQ